MRERTEWKALAVVVVMGLAGCRLIVGTAAVTTAVVAGSVGLVGYSVYKGGEAAVSGVASVASSDKETTTKKKPKTIKVSRGTFSTNCSHTIADLYVVAERVLEEAKFSAVVGRQDSLSAAMRAKTTAGETIFVKFDLLEKNLTQVRILIGEGNLKQSEYIYDLILEKVEAQNGGAPL